MSKATAIPEQGGESAQGSMEWRKEQLQQHAAWCEANPSLRKGKSATEAFVIWDRDYNGRQCLDYDREKNYYLGLLTQANRFLTSVHTTIVVAGTTVQIQDFQEVDGAYKAVEDMNAVELRTLQSRMKVELQNSSRRLRAMGKGWKYIESLAVRYVREEKRQQESLRHSNRARRIAK